MVSYIKEKKMRIKCPNCGKLINKAWQCKYESQDYTRLVYLCSECCGIIELKTVDSSVTRFKQPSH